MTTAPSLQAMLASYVAATVTTDDEHAAWLWIVEHLYEYPRDRQAAPFAAPRWPARAKAVVGVVMRTDAVGVAGEPAPSSLETCDGDRIGQHATPATDDGADAAAAALFRSQWRGRLLATWGGATWDYHLMLRYWCARWLTLGYTIHPLAASANLRALVVRRGRQSWWLCDGREMTGLREHELSAVATALLGSAPPSTRPSLTLYRTLTAYGEYVAEHMSCALRATLGSTAMTGAKALLAPGVRRWRPGALLTTLCRAAHAYRGGYVMATPYRGPLWRADLSRAYSWALTQPMPLAGALGRCVGVGGERDGVYLCRVEGPGILPAYVGRWAGERDGFVRDHWGGERCLSVLPHQEVAGLRAAGYRVTPGIGWVFTHHFDLRGLVRASWAALRSSGDNPVLSAIAKGVPNAVYGKLAERPERDDTVFALTRPSREWWPFLTPDGGEVPHLYTRQVTRYSPHQLIDAAAVVTARVRGRLYEACAAIERDGGRVVAADTDGLLSTIDPTRPLGVGEYEPGAWRLVGYDPRATVAARRRYVFGGVARNAGARVAEPRVIELVADGHDMIVRGQRVSPGWGPGPVRQDASVKLAATPA